ncbi:MAG: NAD(P)/FAD-dependent oxidoreductase [Ktedonobacteraceae bacterium]|nr:NAD(P)/FAD-dependent oxidoreductase [Ktedonobacteraceae bacterium]
MEERYDLAIVGAGLSTLSMLSTGISNARTVVLDYQEAAGGFLQPLLPATGFEDAWELTRTFRMPADVTIYLGATAVGLLPALDPGEPHIVMVRQRQGTTQIRARRVLIACGGLEATREHAQIPGTRPAGVMTPILALQLLARGYLPGRQALVYGSGRYAEATARRLSEAGLQVTHIASTAHAGGHGAVADEIVEIVGFPRLEGVRLRRGGQIVEQAADMLVYSAGMLANTHWLKGSGVRTGENGAIQVDAGYQTNIAGIYAVGTVVAPSLDHSDSITMGKEVASLIAGGLS